MGGRALGFGPLFSTNIQRFLAQGLPLSGPQLPHLQRKVSRKAGCPVHTTPWKQRRKMTVGVMSRVLGRTLQRSHIQNNDDQDSKGAAHSFTL